MEKDGIKTCFYRKIKKMCYIFILWTLLIFEPAPGCGVRAGTLTLQEGLRLATENSRLIKIAAFEESMAEADTRIARSILLPEITTSLGQTWLAYQPGAIFGTMTVPVSDDNFLSYSLNVQQILYDFKGNASRYEAKKSILKTKRLDMKRVKNLAAVDFVLAYLGLLESEKMLVVAQKEVERLESHDQKAKALYGEGVITKNDLLQTEVRISDAKQRLLTAGNVRAMAASRLNHLLVWPLETDVRAEDIEGMPAEVLACDLEEAWRIAEAGRPELQIADETLNSLDLEVQSKRAEYYPEFFMQGGFDYAKNRYQLHEGNWSITLGMRMNLFNGGRTGAEISMIEQQRLKLLEQRNKLADEIKLEVEQYMLASRSARERVSVTMDAVQQGEENLRITGAKYEEGVGTATDVLDAVTLLTVAETNYYKSLYDLRKAEASLLYATGEDLTEVYQ